MESVAQKYESTKSTKIEKYKVQKSKIEKYKNKKMIKNIKSTQKSLDTANALVLVMSLVGI